MTEPTSPAPAAEPAGTTTIASRSEVTVAVPREHAFHVARGKNDDRKMRRHGARAIFQNPVDNIPQSEGQGKQAGFFLKFSARCVGSGLAQLDSAARKRPEAIIRPLAALDQEHLVSSKHRGRNSGPGMVHRSLLLHLPFPFEKRGRRIADHASTNLRAGC